MRACAASSPSAPTFQLAASVLSCGVSSRSGSSRILQQRQAALRVAELEILPRQWVCYAGTSSCTEWLALLIPLELQAAAAAAGAHRSS